MAMKTGVNEMIRSRIACFVSVHYVCLSQKVQKRTFLSSLFLSVLASKSNEGENVKAKFTLEQATKAQRGSRGIAVLFL